jgi:aryl-alcohol dehydrogenase-like predicted oxidoreductase
MQFRTFPKTDLSVSEVGFGVWTLATGWWGEKTPEESVAMLRRARDLGITFFDTADTYGNGLGETLLRDAFGSNPEGVIYATKFGYDIYDHGNERRGQREIPHRFDPEFIRFACEQSLKRLGVDAIPLWQIHNAHMEHVQNDEIWETLETLKQEGKVRHYGVAVGPANGWLWEGIGAMRHRDIDSLQVIHNMLEQHPGSDFFPDARENNVGLLVRVPHSSGMLEGKYTPDTTFAANDHRRHRPKSWLINGLQKLETLKFLTEGRNQTLGQAAIKFILSEQSVVSVLPNIYDYEQLEEFAKAPDLPDLTADDLNRIAELEKINFGVEEEEPKFKGEPESALLEWESRLAVAK